MKTAKDYSNTLDWFRFLTGIEDIEACLKHCLPACVSIQAQVLTPKYRVNAIPQLYYAAAALAFYHYCLSRKEADPKTIDAGDLTIRMEPQKLTAHAKELLDNAFAAARPFLKSGAVFKSIGG